MEGGREGGRAQRHLLERRTGEGIKGGEEEKKGQVLYGERSGRGNGGGGGGSKEGRGRGKEGGPGGRWHRQ